MPNDSPIVLVILDGWGYREHTKDNAIQAARTPQWDTWWRTCPHMLLEASGQAVGLPDAQMGNSEVGHMHIGAGRVIPQDFTRINEAIQCNDFLKNPVFLKTIATLKHTKKALHVMGLLSPGGVHSHEAHLWAFLDLCAQQNFSNVYLHLFLDGRDTPPQSALTSIETLHVKLTQYPVATIASISGRYYAMDRDKRWQRIAPVYHLLVNREAPYQFASAEKAIEAFYQQQIFDEFIPPTMIGNAPAIQEGDAVFFFNFRADRARELTQSLIETSFDGFARTPPPKLSAMVTMTSYAKTLATEAAFPPLTLPKTLGEIIAEHGLRQLRIAETEKYAHVTFFFNGGNEESYPKETRILIPSPAVATYDLQPEMSATQLTETLIDAIKNRHQDVIICNYANADMVGHTGNFAATVQAIECLDTCLHNLWQALSQVNGQLLITSDHGNAESMFDDATQQAHTAHTNLPVPFLYVGKQKLATVASGSLIDIAPTILSLLNIKPPKEMTGKSLLHYAEKGANPCN